MNQRGGSRGSRFGAAWLTVVFTGYLLLSRAHRP